MRLYRLALPRQNTSITFEKLLDLNTCGLRCSFTSHLSDIGSDLSGQQVSGVGSVLGEQENRERCGEEAL
ncbi:hypothetical protein DPEC_G00004250 [Dallia pectoralis]|uniref:Uncharacterized protein n=1 Tax=Dallia pectoralis TaxID=75939 RepID=A0ACC2HJF3_DALPE|nr:hypothetical protein DPEC_G00004250 [Dallia pectoralis]